jgi:glutaredoxin 2
LFLLIVMSSFVNAAPFENETPNNNIDKKRMSKTLKKPLPKLPKLQLTSMDDEENNLADFRPPPHPIVTAKEGHQSEDHEDEKEGFSNEASTEYVSEYPQKYEEKPLSKMQQYKQFVSNIQNNIQPVNNSLQQDQCPEHYSSMDDHRKNYQKQLNEKIDYMIKMLEDQRSEKTEGVIEDVMLFSFIGIFTIFLVESFTKVGKYVR